MPSLTVENYVKAIYQLAHAADDGAVATGQIAAALGVLPGTVTSMLKTLDESNLATYTPYEGVRLTPSGRALALRVLRRHRLIEQFLSQTLNLTWDEVHEEAEHMEHAVSDCAGRSHRRLPRPPDDRSARRPDSQSRWHGGRGRRSTAGRIARRATDFASPA